ncbi:hypothetical protein Pelo_3227 [Pelomyxa schiedti]|nr:hypothetical protein Pelo_3227 [Pelomyxa schiedti]
MEPLSKRSRVEQAVVESQQQVLPAYPPENQPRSEPVPLHSALVASTTTSASRHLSKLAMRAEKRAKATENDVVEIFGKLRANINEMLDERISCLKREIHSNLETSLNGLVAFNPNQYEEDQKFTCPRDRTLSVIRRELSSIVVTRGKHILDLPIAVLCRIVWYLPHKTVLSSRLVCFQLWDAVRTVYGCENITFSATASNTGSLDWPVAQCDTIVTPRMNLKLMVQVNTHSHLDPSISSDGNGDRPSTSREL